MVEQLIFRKKACGNFITNIANVLTTFVKENDEVQVEERLAADKAKRIVDIKAAAELAERNSLLAQIADLEKAQARQKTLDAQSKLEEAAKELEAFKKLPIAWQKAYLSLNQ